MSSSELPPVSYGQIRYLGCRGEGSGEICGGGCRTWFVFFSIYTAFGVDNTETLMMPLPPARGGRQQRRALSAKFPTLSDVPPLHQVAGLWVFLPELVGLCQGPSPPWQWLWLNVKYSWAPLFLDPFYLACACGSLCPLCSDCCSWGAAGQVFLWGEGSAPQMALPLSAVLAWGGGWEGSAGGC